MMPKFYQNHMGKFAISFIVAAATMLTLGMSDTAYNMVTNLLGQQAVGGIMFGCFLVVAFNVALANLRTEDEISYRARNRR